jgi:thioesterase domain-containing protein
VRLMARVQRLYGLDLPVAALIEAPTVQRFAALLERAFGGETRAQRSLIALRAGQRDEAPLFCIHPIGGNVLCYMPLARRLGRACYGLQARALDGRHEPHTSVREMAKDYAAEIVARQPTGRIQLAGWSFGGYVAVEMARQLQAAGRELAPIIVADTIASMKWQVELQDDELLEFMAMELLGTQIDEQLASELFAREAGKAQKLATLMAAARQRGVASGEDSGAHLEHVLTTIRANFRAVYTHTLERYSGEVVLLRCIEAMPPRLRRFHDRFGSVYHAADNGWGQYCPNLRVVPVHGDHLSLMLEPNVAQIAEVVMRTLDGRETSLSA